MISTKEALQIITETAPPPSSVRMSVLDASGCVLSRDIIAPVSSPHFHQAAMDGYGFAFDTVDLNALIPVHQTVQAGAISTESVSAGTAVRIFTGAPVPEGVDTIVMQEWVEETPDGIRLLQKNIIKGSHIRIAGSQIEKGNVAVRAGTRLNPGVVGFLCSLGISEVDAFTAPAVGIVITGKELIFPGEELRYGKIYESNAPMLIAALYEARMEPVFVTHTDDNLEEISAAIQSALKQCDLLLICGGISTGKFDFVKEALNKNDVKDLFYKVKQKPGKPLYFGKSNSAVVFGLPGNPAAVLTCFYHYVMPCIRTMSGLETFPKNSSWVQLGKDEQKKIGLTYLLKGKVNGNTVEILDGQESFKVNAFTEANCLVELDEHKSGQLKGELVKVYHLDQLWN